jgi:hypothetical protein
LTSRVCWTSCSSAMNDIYHTLVNYPLTIYYWTTHISLRTWQIQKLLKQKLWNL